MDKNENVLVNKASSPPFDMKKPAQSNTSEKVAGENENQQACLAFGWRTFRPKGLQFLNCSKWFFAAVSVYTLCQGISIIGLTSLVLPSIERRFSLTSKDLGLIASSNDITALLLVVFISYYGDYGNKIKWIAGGGIFLGFGTLMFTLPHFMTGKYQPVDVRRRGVCLTNATLTQLSSSCEGHTGSEWYHMAVFVSAQLIVGGGVAPMYSLLPAYLDENVEPKSLPVYLGIWYCFSFAGPGLGYLIGGKLLTIYVDIKQPAGQDLTPKHPGWIGAWWIGFLIFGSLILLSSLVLLGFPRELPGARERRQKHIRQGHLTASDGIRDAKLRDFLPGLKNLLTNWTYLFGTVGISVYLLYGASVNVFLAKIFRLKFGLDPEMTGYVISIISMVGVTLGSLGGSLVTRMFSLREACKKAALVRFIANLITVGGALVFIIPGCMNVHLAGVSAAYHSQGLVNGDSRISTTPSVSNVPLKSSCNLNCSCPLNTFSPVCGSDSKTYFDACHAGCRVTLPNKTYANCSCIPGSSTSPHNGTARPGYCDRNCKNIVVFAALTTIIGIIRMMTLVPGRIVTLRCVPDNRRAFALGIQYVSLKTIGLLPGPIIFGHLVDLSCRLWQDICGNKGRCFDYNIEELSRIVAIYGTAISITTAFFQFLSWYLYKPELNKTDIGAEVIKNPGAEQAETTPEVTKF